MNDRSTRAWPRVAASALAILGITSALVLAQSPNPPQQQTQRPPQQQAQPAVADEGTASLSARLIDEEEFAAHHSAAVEVQVTGIKMIDPATVGEKPAPGQGHLHYQIDDGPVIATTATELSFHGLKPGPHKIKVMLAANDHSALGPNQTLSISGDAKMSEGKSASGEHGYGHEKHEGKGDKDDDDDDKEAGEHVAQAKEKEKPTLTAKLVDEAKNTARNAMTVEVTVSNTILIDPLEGKDSGKNEGEHLHYALDDGPIVATSMKKLSYHGLRPGTHKVKVSLADAHHKPIGAEQTLQITIP